MADDDARVPATVRPGVRVRTRRVTVQFEAKGATMSELDEAARDVLADFDVSPIVSNDGIHSWVADVRAHSI